MLVVVLGISPSVYDPAVERMSRFGCEDMRLGVGGEEGDGVEVIGVEGGVG